MDKSKLFGFCCGVVLCVAFCGLIVYAEWREPYHYRAYILNDQYIGNITADGNMYTNILIMDIQPLVDNRENIKLYYEDTKYGFHYRYNVEDPDLHPVGAQHKIYFANEKVIRSDLKNNDVIAARWTNPIIGKSYIRGVGMFSDGIVW